MAFASESLRTPHAGALAVFRGCHPEAVGIRQVAIPVHLSTACSTPSTWTLSWPQEGRTLGCVGPGVRNKGLRLATMQDGIMPSDMPHVFQVHSTSGQVDSGWLRDQWHGLHVLVACVATVARASGRAAAIRRALHRCPSAPCHAPQPLPQPLSCQFPLRHASFLSAVLPYPLPLNLTSLSAGKNVH